MRQSQIWDLTEVMIPRSEMPQALQKFLRLEAAGGILLFICAMLALAIANSPLAAYYDILLDLPIEVRIGSFEIAKPVLLWINDGLMAIFFFLVGLELKREVIEGHLSSLRRASLPAIAAVGGMLVPAFIYWALNKNDPLASGGWAIPTATDIAFALGVLSLLGDRAPTALKALLLSIAVFDDLGAIIVIAVFYTADLSTMSLGFATVFILGLACLNRCQVVRPAAYLLLGVALWIAVLKSGVHATFAGVVVAMFIPLNVPVSKEGKGESESLLRSLEHALHPWVAFGVLPVFAFANAGVSFLDFSFSDVLHPVPLGIMSGLFWGKQAGVFLLCWLAVRLGVASLPRGVRWPHLYGLSLLCGIGFTMSLFIASLAFEHGDTEFFGLERLGILIGSLISGLCGYAILHATLKKQTDSA
jgi:Na+:H+ antiporter, NhaA family